MARLLQEFESLEGRTVFLRTGYDLPLDVSKDRLDPDRVSDDSRILDSLETLRYLISRKARILLEPGWLGRPSGEDPELSMACVALRLSRILEENGLLSWPVLMSPNALDKSRPRSVYKNKGEVAGDVRKIQAGQVLVLENVRYDPEANTADEGFGAFLAGLAGTGALYVNESEAQKHRPEASITVTPIKIAQAGGDACLGFNYARAVALIGGISETLQKPGRGKFAFLLTGKKIETKPGITSKMTVGNALLDKMVAGDAIIVQGAVAYTFLLAQDLEEKIRKNEPEIDAILSKYGSLAKQAKEEFKKSGAPGAAKLLEEKTAELDLKKSSEILELVGLGQSEAKKVIGDSYADYKQLGEQLYFAYKLIQKAKQKQVSVITAYDHVITNKLPNKSGELPADAETREYPAPTGIPAGWIGVAPGPITVRAMCDVIESSAFVLIAGPASIEDQKLEAAYGTHRLLFEAMGRAKQKGAVTLAAGGDTAALVNKLRAQQSFSVVSNAGGATLELIEKGTSPGLQAVEAANAIARARG